MGFLSAGEDTGWVLHPWNAQSAHQRKRKSWVGVAMPVQGALDAVTCQVFSSSTTLGQSLTRGFDIDAQDIPACVMFSALFVQFSCRESREMPCASE